MNARATQTKYFDFYLDWISLFSDAWQSFLFLHCFFSPFLFQNFILSAIILSDTISIANDAIAQTKSRNWWNVTNIEWTWCENETGNG